MPIGILRGPAGGSKSQWYRRNAGPRDLLFDVTTIWTALRGLERGADGRYPVREDDDVGLGLALYLRSAAVREASRRDLNGWATTSSSTALAVERLREKGATGQVVTVGGSLSRRQVEERLADNREELDEYEAQEEAIGTEDDPGRRKPRPRPQLSRQCRRAVRRWFGRRGGRRR